ncbi:MAG: UTRA domain-containing protein [Streptosporangiales bacterium]|nr:UTRA domain-containing protein [Streptosporangiales bacterium]
MAGGSPKYVVIAEALRRRCRALPPGSKLPPESELALEFGVSRMTLRQAVQRLVEEEMVDRIAGRGTYVRRPPLAKGPTLTSFTEDMRARGLRPSSRLVGWARTAAPAEVARALALAPGDAVLAVERLRSADDEPVCLELAHLPARLEPLLGAGDLEGSLYEALLRIGVRVTAGTRRVHAVALTPREAMLLGRPAGSPGLEVVHLVRDQRRRPIEYARSLYRPDRYELVAEIFREPHEEATVEMAKNAHTSPDLPTPAGPYSHVVEAGGFVYTAGLGPQDPDTGAAPDGIAAQTDRVIDNIERALAAVGLSIAHVVKTTVHLQHLDRDFAAYNEVYARRFAQPYPVRTTVGSSLPGILIEVDVVAVRPDRP